MNFAVLGVDPGVRGGLALLDPAGKLEHLRAFYPGMEESEFINAIRFSVTLLKSFDGPTGGICFMEKVGYIKGDGGQGAFTFGKVYGLLRGVIRSSGVQINDVYPAAWQSSLNCLTGGNKNVSKARAIALYPEEKITHGIADALLIARYGWERMTL